MYDTRIKKSIENKTSGGYIRIEKQLNIENFDEEDENEDVCYYDNIKDSNRVNDLLNLTMSDVETKIINNILNGSSKLKFDSKLYNCTAIEFNNDVENIKSKLSIIGLEEN